MARGRPPAGPDIVEKYEASDIAKKRAKEVLETIKGIKTIDEAAAELGVGPARFHELRDEFMLNGIRGLEPKPAGRPRKADPELDPAFAALAAENRALKEENLELKIENKASKVREEIALTLPHLLKPTHEPEPEALKKTKQSTVLDKIRQSRKRRP